MSRGPGIHQRNILALVEEYGHVNVTDPEGTNAWNTAARRAAYSLEKAGKVSLTVEKKAGVRRLVAHHPDSPHRKVRRVQGSDGKMYRD